MTPLNVPFSFILILIVYSERKKDKILSGKNTWKSFAATFKHFKDILKFYSFYIKFKNTIKEVGQLHSYFLILVGRVSFRWKLVKSELFLQMKYIVCLLNTLV